MMSPDRKRSRKDEDSGVEKRVKHDGGKSDDRDRGERGDRGDRGDRGERNERDDRNERTPTGGKEEKLYLSLFIPKKASTSASDTTDKPTEKSEKSQQNHDPKHPGVDSRSGSRVSKVKLKGTGR